MTPLTWIKLSTGNTGAIAGDWFYCVGRLDGGWYLESWPADQSDLATASYGYPTRKAARREAAEQAETAEVLTGKYRGIDPREAHRLIAEARKSGEPVRHCVRRGARRVVIGTDQWGYTIAESQPTREERAADRRARAAGKSWVRVEDEHPRWELPGDTDAHGVLVVPGFLITDAVIRTYGRTHVERKLLNGLPPLPEEAWAADRQPGS